MNIAEQTAVVTGAAGGIGFAIAHRLLENGERVVLTDLDRDRVEDAGVALKGLGPVLNSSGDAASEVYLAELLEAVEREFGPVSMFFANAGTGIGQGLEAPEKDWDLAMDINVRGHVRAARLLVPQWLARGEGYFFSTASAAGLLTQLGSPVYSVTKHAAVAFAEWLRVTYGDQGVRVSCLCPMGVSTNMLQSGLDHESEFARQAAAAVVSAGSVLEPLEVADVVIEAIADERFLVLPHPEVAQMSAGKTVDYDRWIRGMQRYRRTLESQ